MYAWRLHEVSDIRLEEIEKPAPGKGEVLLAVKAVGICGSDIPRIYQNGAHVMPLTLGHEFSGQVVALGEEVDSTWLGKAVGVFPLMPCNTCLSCKKGYYEMCSHYNYLGSRTDGAFAEYVVAPVSNLVALPEGVTYEQAAMLEPMAVAIHAMRKVSIKESDWIVVCGLGAIGQFLVMFLQNRGFKNILAIGNKDFQLQQVLKAGIPENQCFDSRTGKVKEWIIEKTSGVGADVYFEAVGRNDTIEQAVDSIAPGGSICLIGNPFSDLSMDKMIYWKVLKYQMKLFGTWNSSFFPGPTTEAFGTSDWEYVIDLLAKKEIAPEKYISHRLPLKDLEKGLHIMRDKTEDFCKVMVVME